ncbi:MAG: hypothetical protein HYU98_00230 [Deltaproteobacteria bacterium]|nr:hypothetical protein [Deltaproteobacteria bacterium]
MHSKRTLTVIAVMMFVAGILFASKMGWITDSGAKDYFHESSGAAAPSRGRPMIFLTGFSMKASRCSASSTASEAVL